MNRPTAIFVMSTGFTALALTALTLYAHTKEVIMHNKRMIHLERETQNIKDAKEYYGQVITELDRKIEAGKFWLIVTQED